VGEIGSKGADGGTGLEVERRCIDMEKKSLQIVLTPAQQELLQQATGKEVPAVKLCLEPLEQRLKPAITLN
jgi:hypothetical protein